MKHFGLLGRKLGHSFSPQIHQLLSDYDYQLYEKEPEEVEDFVKRGQLDGFNVTIPYKETVIPFCDVLSETAQKIGSVNTIVYRGGKIEGHNTDYAGFAYLLKKTGVHPAGKKAIVLGSGGSSKTASAVLRDMGAKSVTVISRTGENNYQNLNLHADAQLIVNTTPVGMYPNCGAAPISLADFPACEGVVDIIYNPAKTRLLLDARERQIPFVNGLPMLVAQAKKAAEIFLDKPMDDGVIPEIVRKIESQTKNIAIIGMPGCGKTSVGKALAKKLGRTFVETDDLIPQRAGKSIPDLFREDGEEAFRKIETEVLSDCAKQSGVVLATGGGVVTRPENLPLLRQNSVIVFLRRELQALPLDGRPLSQKYGIQQLAKERLPLYRAWCDWEIESTGVIEGTAERIAKTVFSEERT